MKASTCLRSFGFLTILWMASPLGARAGISSPTELSGCRLWLDASDAATVAQSGGYVSQWDDKSGGGRNVSQGTADNQPQTGLFTQGGKNVLTLDGNDWLSGSAALDWGDDDFTYVIVWRSHTIAGRQVLLEQSNGTDAHGERAALLGDNGQLGFAGEWNDNPNMGAFTSNVWQLTAMVVDGNINQDPSNVHLFENGNAEVLGGIDRELENVGTGGGFRVGANIVWSSEWFSGDVAEVIVYDRVLLNSERADLLRYLDQKWNLGLGIAPTPDNQHIVEFEGSDLPAGWTAAGDAFANQPSRTGRADFKESGVWFVGSFENEKWGWGGTQGDDKTGELASASFQLTGNTVRALVGGGHHNEADSECQVRLEVETAPDTWTFARSETGVDSEAMREFVWNVDDLVGSTVRFRALDHNTGSWGHINFDSLRIGNETRGRHFHTDFTGTRLDPALAVYRPWNDPSAGLTGSGRFRFAPGVPSDSNYDLWDAVNRAPQLRLAVDDSLHTVGVETHLASRSYDDVNNHSGLILVFEDPQAGQCDFVAFGPFGEDGIWAQGPDFGEALGALGGTAVNDVYLRVERRGDSYRFKYSLDGAGWTTVGDRVLSGKKLLYVGLFTKAWSQTANPVTEFVYLDYSVLPPGTAIYVR